MANAAVIANALKGALETQEKQYPKPMSGSVLVPCIHPANPQANRSTLTLTAQADGAMVIDSISFAAYGPCDSAGAIPQTITTGTQTSFPSGLVVSAVAGATQKAERGVRVKITDSRTSRAYTDGYVPLELEGGPGYGSEFRLVLKRKIVIKKESSLIFDFVNDDSARLDSGAQAYHKVTVKLDGEKYQDIEV